MESYLYYVVSGLLVGFGTSLGNGCTSGHGICGLARCSLRSFVAVFTFLTTAIVVATRIAPAISMPLPPLHAGLGWIVTVSGVFAAIFATSRNQLLVVDTNNWKLPGAALSGAMFAAGLALAGVTQTTKVLGFLNVLPLLMSTGSSYDPTWLIALGSAAGLSWCGYQYLSGSHQPTAPLWSRGNGSSADNAHFAIPTSTRVDTALLLGSVCFGLGWGLTGLCPGLALFAAAAGVVPVTLAWLPSFLLGSHVGQLAKLLLYGPNVPKKANPLA
jgi:uncharacterized protein